MSVAAERRSCDVKRAVKTLRSRTAATVPLGVAVVALSCSLTASCGSRSTLDLGAPVPSSTPQPTATVPLPVPVPGVAGQPAMPPHPGMAGSGGAPSVRCESISLTIDDLRPTVTLLVDQSGSMRFGYPTSDSPQSRWTIVHDALLDETNGVVHGLEQSMQFAVAFYTSHNGTQGGVCPIISEVKAKTGNYQAIRALYDATSPDDDTPTGAAIAQVVSEITVAKRKGSEILLLVTDGDPDTCDVPDPQTDAAQTEAVTAARAAFAAGIDFYVLGISNDISGDKLQQLANAGQGKRLEARWGVDADAAQPFQASSSLAGLTAQFRDILARAPLCDVGLDRDVSPDELIRAKVVLDGQELEFGAPNGYELTDPRHLRVQGSACETLRAQGKRLTVRISCDRVK